MDMLDAIKMELDGNDLLLEDFPEALFPIQALDGIANRCNGQLYKGERTHIGWTAREVVLPTLKPDGWLQRDDLRPFVREDGTSKASGAIIKVAGITGRIRGMKYKRADGRTVRPTLVVLDDPQTDESARSLSQCATRESILAGAVLGLSGPGTKIAGIMPCTVIRPGDMADAILDRDSTRSGTASGPSSSTRSRPTRPCGSGTPRSGPRACGRATAVRRRPRSTETTGRRWTRARSSPGRSGSTTTSCPPSSTP
jgi:hypothetical protein